MFGPNGAGKTTLLRMLATLLVPHEGELRVLDSELPREAHRVRPRVGLLAHEPLLYRDLSGRENLRFYARLYDVAEPERPDRRTCWRCTGMTTRADEPVRNLSRGMAQRIGDLPGGAASARAAAAGRAAGAPGPGSRRDGGAPDRRAQPASHACWSRTTSSTGWPRPTGCSACGTDRSLIDAPAAGLGAARRARPLRSARHESRRGDRPQGPGGGAAHQGVGAGDGPVRRDHLRDLPFRARSRPPRGGAGRGGPVGHAAVRRDPRHQPAVRRRARAGRASTGS